MARGGNDARVAPDNSFCRHVSLCRLCLHPRADRVVHTMEIEDGGAVLYKRKGSSTRQTQHLHGLCGQLSG